ncbi:MAG: SMC-Scp complex subunit ScpB [Clostridia bacterium]|nr:SMC-Scp complex subunit ScpB [Clostridia bacterium]
MNISSVLESLLFVSGDGITISQLAEILEVSEKEVILAADKLKSYYEENGRGITLVRYDEYVQLKTVEENFTYVNRLAESKRKLPLSPAAMEILSIVAYHQPVTRASIEFIRGVNCDGPMSKLIERGLIEEGGRLDAPGRPILYVTTKEFLRSFGISSLDELPDAEALEELTGPISDEILEAENNAFQMKLGGD